MTSFSVLPRAGSASFTVDRMDVNHWVLPGIFGRQVIYSDVGLRLVLTSNASQATPIKFDLGVPFTAREDGLDDLGRVMRQSAQMCALVFGDINAVPRHDASANIWQIDDGSGPMRLEAIDRTESRLDADVKATGRPFSVWTISTGSTTVASGDVVYVRVRFHVRKPGSTWSWQRGERRRSHAISDLRVNELRDKPRFDHAPPALESALHIERTNIFVINPARLKAGRVNPQPKYVRILEGDLWDDYLGRRLSRRDEPFVATYWRQTAVNRDKPFRAFLEVERRRPTSGKWALVTVLLMALVFVLLQSPTELRDSVLLNTISAVWKVAAGVVTGGAILSIARVVLRSVSTGTYRRLGAAIDWLEAKLFRRRH